MFRILTHSFANFAKKYIKIVLLVLLPKSEVLLISLIQFLNKITAKYSSKIASLIFINRHIYASLVHFV